MTPYDLRLTGRAKKQLAALPVPQRKLVAAWIDRNLVDCANPRAVAGGKKLEGVPGGWRWRVGSYRILARLQDDVLVIELFRIGHRGAVYRNI